MSVRIVARTATSLELLLPLVLSLLLVLASGTRTLQQGKGPASSALQSTYLLGFPARGSRQQGNTPSEASIQAALVSLGGSLKRYHAEAGIATAVAPKGALLEDALSTLGVTDVMEDVVIERAEPINFAKVLPEQSTEANSTVTACTSAKLLVGEPTDTLYPFQWAPQSLRAAAAWRRGITGECVRIAVVDSGLDPDHLDLSDRVDRSSGKSFVPGFEYYEDGQDAFPHARHVAGIAAGNLNFGGVVGIAPRATIVPVKVLHDDYGTLQSVVDGIIYAATPISKGGGGAHIINLSLGAYLPAKNSEKFRRFYGRAIAYANKYNVLVVASAGNMGVNIDKDGSFETHPCQAANVVCVSATAPMGVCGNCMDDGTVFGECTGLRADADYGRLASYSNYGQASIWVAAPGGDFGSYPKPCWYSDMIVSAYSGTNGYAWVPGTSMAAPAVAGVAALYLHKEAMLLGLDMCSTAQDGTRASAAGAAVRSGQVKAALARGAVQPISNSTAANRQRFGNGIVDVVGTLGLGFA